MKIDHVALYVDDLEGMKEFFVRYFGGVADTRYHNDKTGRTSYSVTFEDEGVLELINEPQSTGAYLARQYLPEFIHFAFQAGSRDQVDQLTKQLERDGYDVLRQPRITGQGRYQSCVRDKEGNHIEIIV